MLCKDLFCRDNLYQPFKIDRQYYISAVVYVDNNPLNTQTLIFIHLEVWIAVAIPTSRWMKIT